MSMDRCSLCDQPVDTDLDDEFYEPIEDGGMGICLYCRIKLDVEAAKKEHKK